MGLTIGTKLGPYEIVSPLGAGGMGEVYRARDTRLDRSVAIKVLPSHLSSNLDLRARFEREAKAISRPSFKPEFALRSHKMAMSRLPMGTFSSST